MSGRPHRRPRRRARRRAGTHEELLAANGLYATLWQVQVGGVQALPDAFVNRVEARADALDTDD